jgi:hypothetical protein
LQLFCKASGIGYVVFPKCSWPPYQATTLAGIRPPSHPVTCYGPSFLPVRFFVRFMFGLAPTSMDRLDCHNCFINTPRDRAFRFSSFNCSCGLHHSLPFDRTVDDQQRPVSAFIGRGLQRYTNSAADHLQHSCRPPPLLSWLESHADLKCKQAI